MRLLLRIKYCFIRLGFSLIKLKKGHDMHDYINSRFNYMQNNLFYRPVAFYLDLFTNIVGHLKMSLFCIWKNLGLSLYL